MDRAKLEQAIKAADATVLMEAALELLALQDRDTLIADYMFLRSQHEGMLAGIRKLYDDARAEQVARAHYLIDEDIGAVISDIDSRE